MIRVLPLSKLVDPTRKYLQGGIYHYMYKHHHPNLFPGLPLVEENHKPVLAEARCSYVTPNMGENPTGVWR